MLSNERLEQLEDLCRLRLTEIGLNSLVTVLKADVRELVEEVRTRRRRVVFQFDEHSCETIESLKALGFRFETISFTHPDSSEMQIVCDITNVRSTLSP